MKLEFSQHYLKKCSNIKFHEIHPVGAAFFHADGQTDRHDQATSYSSQFWKYA